MAAAVCRICQPTLKVTPWFAHLQISISWRSGCGLLKAAHDPGQALAPVPRVRHCIGCRAVRGVLAEPSMQVVQRLRLVQLIGIADSQGQQHLHQVTGGIR